MITLRKWEIDGVGETAYGTGAVSVRGATYIHTCCQPATVVQRNTDRFLPRYRGFNPHWYGHCVYAKSAQHSPDVDWRITNLRVSYCTFLPVISSLFSHLLFSALDEQKYRLNVSRYEYFTLAPCTRRRSFRNGSRFFVHTNAHISYKSIKLDACILFSLMIVRTMIRS